MLFRSELDVAGEKLGDAVLDLALSHEGRGAVVEGVHLLHALAVRVGAHVKLLRPATLEETHAASRRGKEGGEGRGRGRKKKRSTASSVADVESMFGKRGR